MMKKERRRTCQLMNDNHFKPSFFTHSKTVQSWKTEAERRAFFDNFAASKEMDSRNPVFWSRVTVRELCRFQPVRLLPLVSPLHPLLPSLSFFIFVDMFCLYFFAGFQNDSRILRGTVIHVSHAALS